MSGATVHFKARLGHARAWSTSNDQVAPAPPTDDPVPRVARLLALAHHVERAVLDGRVADYTTAARALGMSQPRIAQILDLIFLAPSLQEAILRGQIRCSENALRFVLRHREWTTQRQNSPTHIEAAD